MCDELTEKDNEEFLRKQGLTRRDFSKGAAGVALSMMLPAVANAMDVVEDDVLAETPDGMADCYFVRPGHSTAADWQRTKTVAHTCSCQE